jgi:lipoprotein-anchoring transpeptidase ErfK/SrfK
MSISRRDFLKLGGVSLGALAFGPLGSDIDEPIASKLRARVTVNFIYVYQEPDFRSPRIGIRLRDALLPLREEVISPFGPPHNRLWYSLRNGFIYSAYLQRVEKAHLSQPLSYVPENGQLGEVTVPYSESMRWTRQNGWKPLYRLYFESVHWITSLDEGPDGAPWYGLTDERLRIQYHIPATHVRPIQAEEISPISPEVPPQEKRIEVSIPHQTLTAYEGKQVVLQTLISSGIPGREASPADIPTATPEGFFHVEVKMPSKHMGDGNLTDDIRAYELPGVPWVSFFHVTGVALHGTYWHNNFGRMMSHGCVNMRTEEAKWIYRWTMPVADPQQWDTRGHGTLVRVIGLD